MKAATIESRRLIAWPRRYAVALRLRAAILTALMISG